MGTNTWGDLESYFKDTLDGLFGNVPSPKNDNVDSSLRTAIDLKPKADLELLLKAVSKSKSYTPSTDRLIGLGYIKLANYKSAYKRLENVFGISKNDDYAAALLAQHLNKPKDVILHLSNHGELTNPLVAVAYVLAKQSLKKDDVSDYITHLPKHAESRELPARLLGIAYFNNGAYDKASYYLKKAMGHSKNDENYFSLLASLYYFDKQSPSNRLNNELNEWGYPKELDGINNKKQYLVNHLEKTKRLSFPKHLKLSDENLFKIMKHYLW
jgi:tetratricopeptide (TPR) repeat protein